MKDSLYIQYIYINANAISKGLTGRSYKFDPHFTSAVMGIWNTMSPVAHAYSAEVLYCFASYVIQGEMLSNVDY